MPVKRYYYSDTISRFLTRNPIEIVGELTLSYTHEVNDRTKRSWIEEIETLKTALGNYSNRGSVYFEYNIPRMGRRADAIVIIDGIIFVLEFKTLKQKFTREGAIQVWDYTLDLKNFQEGSRDRFMIPILVVPHEKDSLCIFNLKSFKDGVFQPLLCNGKQCFSFVLSKIPHDSSFSEEKDNNWAKSGYSPTPTIIEAAVALYEEHSVEEITRHDGEVGLTVECIRRIISVSREKKRKAICFVTGVPGAGKTLIGLQTAIDQFNRKEKAIYLSGNFPLVEVLQEALARDFVRHAKEKYKLGLTDRKPCTKEKARSDVKTFIQMVHHYRDLYLEGTEIKNGAIVPIPGYFKSHKDKAFVPADHVAIFDEAQRAWRKDELVRFMKEKKGIENFPYSEPEYLISCMDRRPDWGVVICLIGDGQEINKGEAGVSEWFKSINRNYQHWDVYMSDQLVRREYAQEEIEKIKSKDNLFIEPSLHLTASMRSFRAEKVSLFVQQLLDLKQKEASQTLKELTKYPIVLTRSLDSAKKWLREHARGSERIGILASSKAERLKAISINVRYQPNFVRWFLEDESDIRSSNSLEDTLTEFKVQGLEIDWACVAWDADLRLNEDHTEWQHFQLRSGTKWQNINKPENQVYQVNAYRVLLTRARQGMIIVVPKGNIEGEPLDETRNPKWYGGIYDYLKGIGIPEV